MPYRSPVEAFVERRQRMRALLGERRLAAAVVASGLPQPRNFANNLYPFRASSHFLYLLGEPLEAAVLLVTPEHEVLYVDPPDPEASLWTGPQPTLGELADRLAVEVRPLDEFDPPTDGACLAPVDCLSALWLGDLLNRPLEPADGLAQSEADALLADIMIALRLKHDSAALAQLRVAVEVTEQAHLCGMRETRRCGREFEVCASMQSVISGSGCALAYAPIVTVHGEVLHNERHDNLLQSGGLLLADVGAETPEGWAADITRTWPVSGRFSSTQRDLYEVVLAAQARAFEGVRPGVGYLEVHLAALETFATGLRELGILKGSVDALVESGAAAVFLPHGIGHLLGLDVHDMEDLGDRAGYARGRERSNDPGLRYLRLDRDLEPGMLVTVEPGFYQIPSMLARARNEACLAQLIDFDRLASFGDVRGIRIEDDVLVTEQGHEVLSQALPRTPDAVEAACL